MNTPQYGIPIVAGYGNGGSTNASIPMIDSRIGLNAPSNFRPPSLTNPPAIPILERLTPRSVNATKTLETVRAKLVTNGVTGGVKAIDNILANIRSFNMHARRIITLSVPDPKPLYTSR